MFPLSPEALPWYLLYAAPSLAVLVMVLLNLAVWPRGRAKGRLEGRVSVCIPARNEGRHIVACVRAVLAGTQRPDELLVYDDGSTDGTAEILDRLTAGERILRVVRGTGELPPGWLGKAHACHRLAQEATGDVLVFVDADAVPTDTFLARLGWVMEHWRADLVTAHPRELTGTLTEQMVVPLLELAWMAWLPVPLMWRAKDPRIRVANGQIVAARRQALERVGGWKAASGTVDDGAALAKAFKEAGFRVVYAQGQNLAAGRRFEGRQHLWAALSRHLSHGIAQRPLALVLAALLYAALLAPYVGLWLAVEGHRAALLPSLIGVGANVLIRIATAFRLGQISNGILLHPVGIVWLFAIGINAIRLSRRGVLDWRGRKYTLRARKAKGAESA